MSCNVFANDNEISCKGGDNKVIAEFPDVCLSPPSPPAGPIPVPYPDTSFSKDMQSGSKTVMIKDKEVMLKDKSFYKTSPLGDEAATNGLGANVLTHTITGKTYCVSWSMDVKIEGENVDRHMDLTTSNHMCAPAPGGTGPTGMTSAISGLPIVNPRQPAQTCTNDELDAINARKDAAKARLDKRDDCSPSRSDKMKQRIPCSRIQARIQAQQDLLQARQDEQTGCFANGPDPNNAKSVKSYQTHQDQINETANGLANSQAQAAINCTPPHPMANL
jgi:hypothetical protein